MMPMAPAGSMSGILAALTAAIAFTAIKFVPKSEPTVVLALWFHCSALATAIVPLTVRLLHTQCWETGQRLMFSALVGWRQVDICVHLLFQGS